MVGDGWMRFQGFVEISDYQNSVSLWFLAYLENKQHSAVWKSNHVYHMVVLLASLVVSGCLLAQSRDYES